MSPSPFDIFGALSTIGAQGATGAYTGKFEGEEVRRKHESEDVQNKLRALEAILKGQQVQAGQTPQEQIHGGIIYRFDPVKGTMTPVGPAPQAPLNELQRTTADLHRAQTANIGELEPKVKQALTEWRQKPQNAGKSLLDFQRDYTAATHQAPAPHVSTHYSTDAQGRVVQVTTQTDPATGKPTTTQTPLGLIGKPMRAAGEGGGDRTTTTTSTKITPRKPIATDSPTYLGLNKALPDLVNEITGQFQKMGVNFNVPGPWVKLPSGKLVRKEEVIAQAMLEKHGAEVTVRWDGDPAGKGFFGGQSGGKFVITKAWEPAQREPVETVRTTGRGKPAAASPDDDEE